MVVQSSENICMRSQLLRIPKKRIEVRITAGRKTGNIIATCIYCGCVIMSGAFAAKKVRINEDKLEKGFEKSLSRADPTHYSSKFMNSIWGMYNRYSVHNFKKNMDVDVRFGNNGQQKKESVGQSVSVDKSTDYKGSLTVTTTATLLPGLM